MMTAADHNQHQKHIIALHAMKFLGIVTMFVIHIFYWILSDNDTNLSPKGMLYLGFISRTHFLGYFSQMLPMIAGAMQRMRACEKEGEERNGLLHMAGIALALILLGYARNGLTWGLSCLFDWDVLGFIGISYLFIALLSRVSSYLLYGNALVILVLARTIYQGAFQLPPCIQRSYLFNIFVSINTDHFFWPFIPWFALVVFGYFLYDCLLSLQIQGDRKTGLFYGATFVTLLLLATLAYSGPWKFDPRHIWGAWLFHPDLSSSLTCMAVFTGCSCVCLFLIPFLSSVQWLIKPYSAGILWIYLFHAIVGYRLMQVLKPFIDPSVLYFTTLFFLLATGWLIGRAVEYINTHQFEIAVMKSEKGG
jgi:hypothetical protein